MNDSTEHPLHDALHAHVRESGGHAADPYLVGLADGALQVARRRQRLARAGAGIAAAAVLATVWVAVADGATQRAHVVQPATGDTRNAEKAALISILPVTSATDNACTPGSGATPCPRARPTRRCASMPTGPGGMIDVHAASAKAARSTQIGTWRVEVTLGPADRTRFAALTGSIAANSAPRNEFAIVIDGKLWGRPYVNSSITGGRLDIVGVYDGDLTSATAHDLALRLDTGR